MSKTSIKGIIGLLILAGIVKIIQILGINGVIFSLILIGIIYYINRKNKNREMEEQDNAIQIKLHRLDIRQDLFESMNTMNLENATILINRAIETYNELVEFDMTDKQRKELEIIYIKVLKRSITKKYTNQVIVCSKKIKTLKTLKSKDKYFNIANEYILKARSDSNVKQKEIDKIELFISAVYKNNSL